MEATFDLSESLNSLSEDFESFELDPNENPLDTLGDLTDELALKTDSIILDEYWIPIVRLVHCYPELPLKCKYQLSNLVSSSLLHQSEQTAMILNSAEVEMFPRHKKLIEMYAYLAHVLLFYFGKESAKTDEDKVTFRKTNDLISELLGSIHKLLKLDLSLLFQTTPERNLIVGTAILKPINTLMEFPERMKVPDVKLHCFHVIGMAVKRHNQASLMQNTISQHLTYFSHSSFLLAELLNMITEKYDYSQLTDSALKDVSAREFSEADTKGPKSVGMFLTRLSELNPDMVMRQVSLISQLLDNNSFTLRCSVVEVIGNIITNLAKSQEELDEHREQADGFIELLEERFLDVNPYVRSRSIQAITKLSDMRVKFNSRRLRWSKLAVRHLEDRSGLVRRNSIKLITALILNHPYGSLHAEDQGRLVLSTWQDRVRSITDQISKLAPNFMIDQFNDSLDEEEKETESGEDDQSSDEEMEDVQDSTKQSTTEDSDKTNPTSRGEETFAKEADAALFNQLKLTLKFYKDGVAFIKLIHNACKLCCEIIYSKSKTEVVDAMSFFVLCDAYGISTADEGIRKMLHLIWMKGSNEEGNQVVDKLMECYQSLYLTAPSQSSNALEATYIASNLIKLTYNTSMADLVSLERLLCELYLSGHIDDQAIKVLWQFFNSETVSTKQRRGAITVLGMLASANHEISLKGLDLLLNIGLCYAVNNDWILTRYSCISLRRIVPPKTDSTYKVMKEEEAIERLSELLLTYSEDGEWFGMAEQALTAVYTISEHPDVISTTILKEKAASIFNSDPIEGVDNVVSLSQLLFLIGHIGLKTIIHLEKCEVEFKKKKIASENKKSEKDSELDMIGGTNEDEFVDAIQVIKEKELLYSEKGLLAKFVPLIKEIVSNQPEYNNEGLQRQAVLCLSKLMCISPKFCEENLRLYLKIMKASTDPIVRSNAVLGLGDIAVCFNNIIDTNKDYLYAGLKDSVTMVQRTCLMTVTFLILAGQVKVKGQLAEMAKLYVNEDASIVDMCKLFFTELATKDNAIYNGFIDMFSGLSTDNQLSGKLFKEIIKFVVSFIDKDRHRQQLVTKLYQRLLKTDEEQMWLNTAFVIRELIPKQDATSTSRKDKESAKNKLYDEILKAIEEGFKRPELRE
ncbi:hypothetical protein CANARDRAFT_202162 [[Candida] arabinofermentans NRRL YB-2248]|uniref:Condensin complex subunit 1 n=1 Tax=[Candida] arabinofermentans NRRL YB-2248 TaxID=983967 RepID=A0A1E4SWE7_9ASCO|nr:hypothetical protein CANARDRAFT_202162 [[Candida] arabinofermentans NRRL YB-2248]